MMEAEGASETSVSLYQTKRRNIPEDSRLQERFSLQSLLHLSQLMKRC
jgi:hypothetical protein